MLQIKNAYSSKYLAVVNGLLNACSSAVAYLSYVFIAYLYGASNGTDIYWFSVSFITLLSVIFTSIISSIFLPIYIRVKHGNESGPESNSFASAFISWLSIVSILIGAFIFYYAVEIYGLASKFSLINITENIELLRIFSFIFPLIILCEFFRSILQANNHYIEATTGNLIQSIILIGILAVLSNSYGAIILSSALLVSKIIQLIYLYTIIYKLNIKLSINFKYFKYFREFIDHAYIYWFSTLVTVFSAFYFDYSATGLNNGALTSISYSQKLYLFPIVIFINPLMEIVNTKFSEYRVKGDLKKFRRVYTNLIESAAFVLIPISFLIIIFSEDLVEILFGRGKFDSQAIVITSRCLAVYALVIPAVAFFSINGRVVLALQKSKITSLLGVFCHLAMIYLTWILVEDFGYIGIPLAKLLSEYLIFLPFGFLFTYLYLGGISIRGISLEIGKIICANLIIYFILVEYLYEFITQIFINKILVLIILSLIYITSYILISLLLKSSPFSIIIKDLHKFYIEKK